jgi:hypothetical protein
MMAEGFSEEAPCLFEGQYRGRIHPKYSDKSIFIVPKNGMVGVAVAGVRRAGAGVGFCDKRMPHVEMRGRYE